MQPIEIIVIAVSALFVAGVIIAAAVRRMKGKAGSCGCGCRHCEFSGKCAAGRKADGKKSAHNNVHTNKL